MESINRLVIGGPQGAERTISLAEADITLGRAAANDIVLSDPEVSRVHARLASGAAGWTLTDLGSANGTWVNAARLTEPVSVQPGDQIRMGDSLLRLEAGPATVALPLVIDTPADLEATLTTATVSMQVSDTRAARLAIYAPGSGDVSSWEIPILADTLSIGRQATCDVTLTMPTVSRQHARIERRGDQFWLRDLGSANGVFVGARRIEQHLLQNGDTARIGDAHLVFKQASAAEDATLLDAGAPRGRTRPPVVIVPGLMGSELWLGGEKVWPNIRLLFNQPEIFSFTSQYPLEPRGIVGELVIVPRFLEQEQYNRAGDFLEETLGYERGRDLLEFAYDWRQDVRQSALRLAEAIDRWNVQPPITLIAHSLGTLVSRYYIERLGGKDKIGRSLLIGGPHQGTPRIITDLIEGVGLLPFGIMGDRLRDVIKTFPSVYQFAPTYPCVADQEGRPIDLLADETWLDESQIPFLRGAREFHAELGNHSSPPTVCIYGYGLETVMDLRATRGSNGRWSKLDYEAKPGGDNRVPEHSAILPGAEIHPVKQGHGSLYVDNDVKARLKVELTR